MTPTHTNGAAGVLEVLRELLDFEERHAEAEPRANHEGREAIRTVEAMERALNAANEWVTEAPHGDDCFVSSHYEGDPGDRCNCGKDGVLATVDEAIAALGGAAPAGGGDEADIDDGGPYNGIDWQATCEALQEEVAELRRRLASTGSAPAPSADTKRLDWLEQHEASLVTHREDAGDDEYSVWWNVAKGDRSISGHPLGDAREAIDAAMLAAAPTPETRSTNAAYDSRDAAPDPQTGERQHP